MKNLKKILALAIAFVMCFTMFAGALVFSDVPAGGDYSAAITLLSDLGVIAGKPDGSFGINDAITRADAVCLIARLMTGEQNPPKYNNAPVFTDVVPGSYYESSVGYCAALGITSGTGNGQFSPSKTITDGEFVAMLTRALGYDTPEHPLQWPMGNIVVAQQKGLLKNVNIEYASDALRGEDAQMLANALFADYDAWAAKQNLYQRADDQANPTIAEVVFNLGRLAYDNDEDLKMEDSVFFTQVHKKVYNDEKNSYNVAQDCQAHTWVIAGVDAHAKENTYVAYAISDDDNKVVDPTTREIRTKGSEKDEWAYQTFEYSGDITPYIGYQVELWGELDHVGKIKEVAAIRTIEGQEVYDYNASMDDGDDNDKLKFDDKTLVLKDSNAGMADLQLQKDNWQSDNYEKVNGIERVYKLRRGHKDTQVGESDLNIKDGDQFKLFDWDNDGDVDFVVRNTAKYAMVDDLTSKRIVLASIDHDKYPKDKAEKDFENTTKSLDLTSGDLVINADGVEKGDIVEITVDSRVFTKADDETVTITISKVDPETHALTKVSTKGDLASYFDGEEYKMANGGFWDLTEAKDPEDYAYNEQDLKRDFDLFLDRNGFVVYSRYSNGESAKYMMVMEVQDGGGRATMGTHHLPVIKALLEDDKVKTFDAIEKLKIYDVDGTTLLKGDRDNANTPAYSTDNYGFDEAQVVGRVFRYYTNARGEITKLVAATNTATDSTASRNKTEAASDYSYDEKSMSLTDKDGDGSRWNLEKAQAIFVVKGNYANAKHETYVQKKHDNKNNVDYLYVDRDDVIAVDADDIPNINALSGDTHAVNTVKYPSACILDSDERNTTKGYDTWLTATKPAANEYQGADYRAILGYTGSNHDAKVAILGVNSFEGFGRNSVKLGILKDIDSESSEKDGEQVYTFTMAVNGKEQAEYKSASAEELSDILSWYDPTAKKKNGVDLKSEVDGWLDKQGLLYVEVRFDGDLVDEMVITGAKTANADIYEGEYYTVTRAVVGPEKITNILQFNEKPVYFSSDKTFAEVTKQNASAYYVGLNSDTEYYKMDERPTRTDGNYRSTQLLVTNDFDSVSKIEAATVDEIDYSIIHNDDKLDGDDYWVVDIATEKGTTPTRDEMHRKDAVAVLLFVDEMGESGKTAAGGLNHAATPTGGLKPDPTPNADYQLKVGEDGSVQITAGGAVVSDLDDITISDPLKAALTASNSNVTATIVDSKAVKVEAAADAVTGVYTIDVHSAKYGWVSFKVQVAKDEVFEPNTSFENAGDVSSIGGKTEVEAAFGESPWTGLAELTVNAQPGFAVEPKQTGKGEYTISVSGQYKLGDSTKFPGFADADKQDEGFVIVLDMPVPEGMVAATFTDKRGNSKGGTINETGPIMHLAQYIKIAEAEENKGKITRIFKWYANNDKTGTPVTVTYIYDVSNVKAVLPDNIAEVETLTKTEAAGAFKGTAFAGLDAKLNATIDTIETDVNGSTVTLAPKGTYTLDANDSSEFPGFTGTGFKPSTGYVVVFALKVPDGATGLTYNNGTTDKTITSESFDNGGKELFMAMYFQNGATKVTRNYKWTGENSAVVANVNYCFDVTGMKNATPAPTSAEAETEAEPEAEE